MTTYVDASVLVSALGQETNSASAREWLRSDEARRAVISIWCQTEVASAVAAKVRGRTMDADNAQASVATVARRLRHSTARAQVEQRHFAQAAELLMNSPKPLRASDALHLAIAADAGAVVVTLDRGMAEAGQALGLGTWLLA